MAQKGKGILFIKSKASIGEHSETQVITINGAGNPSNLKFLDFVQTLYALACAIKMNLKKKEDRMEQFAEKNSVCRVSKANCEIYLSDFRKESREK